MILIGDLNVPYENIEKIKSIEDIKNTKPNSTLVYDFDIEILHYTMQNNIQSAVVVRSVLDAIYVHNLNVKYIIVSRELAQEVQDLADHYMFDSKVLAVIENASEIEELAKQHIDGVIYKKLLG